METTFNNMPADTLATALNSAVFVPMDSSKGKAVSNGNRWCKLIKKGENSKLPQSLAIEVPEFNSKLETLQQYPALVTYLGAAMETLADNYIKSRAVAGASGISYSELALDKLAAFAQTENESNGIGQLSEEKIKSWFDADARDNVLVALADRLGVTETATEADVKRLEQIANQMRDNLAKLSSKKPVQFDERVKNALNMALDSVAEDDVIAGKLRDKLNMTVNADDLLMNLGL